MIYAYIIPFIFIAIAVNCYLSRRKTGSLWVVSFYGTIVSANIWMAAIWIRSLL